MAGKSPTTETENQLGSERQWDPACVQPLEELERNLTFTLTEMESNRRLLSRDMMISDMF